MLRNTVKLPPAGSVRYETTPLPLGHRLAVVDGSGGSAASGPSVRSFGSESCERDIQPGLAASYNSLVHGAPKKGEYNEIDDSIGHVSPTHGVQTQSANP